jgi:hypothetical protein
MYDSIFHLVENVTNAERISHMKAEETNFMYKA